MTMRKETTEIDFFGCTMKGQMKGARFFFNGHVRIEAFSSKNEGHIV